MLRSLSLLVAALVLGGCDTAALDSQRAFEVGLLLTPPEGITRTDETGAVVSRDPSDWRVGPAFATRVRFLALPFPNPVRRSGTLSMAVDVTGGLPGPLDVVPLFQNPQTGELEFPPPGSPPIDRCRSAVETTICSFSVNPAQIDLTNRGGVYRVALLSGAQVVSYGDVEVQL